MSNAFILYKNGKVSKSGKVAEPKEKIKGSELCVVSHWIKH